MIKMFRIPHLGQQGQDGDAGVAAHHRDFYFLGIGPNDLPNEGLGAHHIQLCYTQHLLRVVGACRGAQTRRLIMWRRRMPRRNSSRPQLSHPFRLQIAMIRDLKPQRLPKPLLTTRTYDVRHTQRLCRVVRTFQLEGHVLSFLYCDDMLSAC